MKINDLHQQSKITPYVSQMNGSPQTDSMKRDREAKENSSSTDKVELSAQAKEMKKIHEVVQATPEVRATKVSALKKLIEEGKYEVESEAIADKMIKETILDLIP
jgi:negative regulator of flagellin synthesis FlgM